MHMPFLVHSYWCCLYAKIVAQFFLGLTVKFKFFAVCYSIHKYRTTLIILSEQPRFKYCFHPRTVFSNYSDDKIDIHVKHLCRKWRLLAQGSTQNQVSGTPHKPALPATQARAPSITPDPKSSNHHTEQWVQWKNKLYERHLLPWLGEEGGKKLESTQAPMPRMLSQAKTMRTCSGACIICKGAADR